MRRDTRQYDERHDQGSTVVDGWMGARVDARPVSLLAVHESASSVSYLLELPVQLC